MKTLIKNGRVVTAVDDYRADIFIDGETVTTIGKRLDMEADVVLDASGRLVIPGGIDPRDKYGTAAHAGLLRRTISLRMQQRIIGRKTLGDCGIEKLVVG